MRLTCSSGIGPFEAARHRFRFSIAPRTRFCPACKDHLFSTLEELDRRTLTNPVLVITRWRVEGEDVERLDRLQHLKLTILVTWSGIDDDRIEPVDSAI